MNWRPPQVTESHLRRRGCNYIRQSSEQQVRENVGSTAIQREGATSLEQLGWEPSRIDHIDEDLGVRASDPGLRSGFDRVIAGMKAGTYGAVSITAIDRLFRNLEELLTFVTAARRHDVLLVNGGQVIDFKDPNSEFIGVLLGANATRENRVRAALSRASRRKKAEQGIATTPCPYGYVNGNKGAVLKDPDPRVRNVYQLMFDKFEELVLADGCGAFLESMGSRCVGKEGHGAILRELLSPTFFVTPPMQVCTGMD